MAYEDIGPSAAAGRPNATNAAASSIARTTWPYKGRADLSVAPRIMLRPPAAPAASDDPTIDAINSVDQVLTEIARSARLQSAPWLIEPPDSESFHEASGISMPAVDGNFHVVAQVTCPEGRNGVLNRIANVVVGGGWSDFSGDAIWRILRNPGAGIVAAERNYENILASLGLVNAPTRISGIRIFENDIVQFVIQNVALPVAGEDVGAILGGYFYPRTWDDQFQAQDYPVAW